MSLYVYVVPATPEQADAYERYVEHRQSLPLFTNHRCWREGCTPKNLPGIYEDSLELGRPMCNEGAGEAERWYGRQVVEGEFGAWLINMLKDYAGTPEGPQEEWEPWMRQHRGQTVIVGNDNEWS